MILKFSPIRLAPAARLLLVTMALSPLVGCASLARPNWTNPGTVEQQRLRALHSDPYPDTDAGPEMVGVRPRDYNKSLPEAVKNQPYSFLDPYGNPAF
ncbi:hypothetical protein [Bremerella cremea]|uniref:hypothetical protein n=1 Tax=Bremerella cremea TaxID=1031537 RepID=UPI0031E69C6C